MTDGTTTPARLLTVAQVAEQLTLSPRTVQRWIRDGRLPAIRLPSGRGYRIYQSDIDRFRFAWRVNPWVQADPPITEECDR